MYNMHCLQSKDRQLTGHSSQTLETSRLMLLAGSQVVSKQGAAAWIWGEDIAFCKYLLPAHKGGDHPPSQSLVPVRRQLVLVLQGRLRCVGERLRVPNLTRKSRIQCSPSGGEVPTPEQLHPNSQAHLTDKQCDEGTHHKVGVQASGNGPLTILQACQQGRCLAPPPRQQLWTQASLLHAMPCCRQVVLQGCRAAHADSGQWRICHSIQTTLPRGSANCKSRLLHSWTDPCHGSSLVYHYPKKPGLCCLHTKSHTCDASPG